MVAGAHLEHDHAQLAGTRVRDEAMQEVARDATPSVGGMDRDVGDVHLVGNLPYAHIAHDDAVLADDEATGDAVLLDLVEERAPRPGHGERGALDGEDLVEVPGAHRLNGSLRHGVAAPLGTVEGTAARAQRRRRCRPVSAARVRARPRRPATAPAAEAPAGARAAT